MQPCTGYKDLLYHSSGFSNVSKLDFKIIFQASTRYRALVVEPKWGAASYPSSSRFLPVFLAVPLFESDLEDCCHVDGLFFAEEV